MIGVVMVLVGIAIALLGCQPSGSSTDPKAPSPAVTPSSQATARARASAAPSPSGPSPGPGGTPPLPTVGTPGPGPEGTPTPDGPEPTGSGPLPLPLRIRIPKIHVDASIEVVGLDPNGAMSVPRRFEDVGWYGYGPIPGEPGASVIAGHVDSIHGPAVFWSLHELRPGDRIEVDLLGGTTLHFVVEGNGSYPSNEAPISTIFALAGPPRLNLITCGGIFDRARRAYDRRLVVYARLETPGTANATPVRDDQTRRAPHVPAWGAIGLPSSPSFSVVSSTPAAGHLASIQETDEG